jgi:hypothetical protein
MADRRVDNKKMRGPHYARYIYAFSVPAWLVPIREKL